MTTNSNYSPWSLLPVPEPKTISPPVDYFYENVAKHLIKDTVRLMSNGLHVDLNKVMELETTLDEQLTTVVDNLASNSLISKFQQLQHSRLIKDYVSDRQSKLKSIDHFLKPFDYKNLTHRSYFMYLFANQQNIQQPTEFIYQDIPKWPANLVKKLSPSYPVLTRLLDGSIKHPLIYDAMTLLATHKQSLYNDKYLQAINNPSVDFPVFNPGSPQQKQLLFEWLGIPSEKTSKTTNLPSYDRDEIQRIHDEATDPLIIDLTQSFIDYSTAAIIRNNFIEAFYKYTVDNRLYGQYKLLGAKTG